VIRTLYHARGNCTSYDTEGNPPTVANQDVAVDTIRYTYDLRDRLTQLTSTLYTEDLFYDGNQDADVGPSLTGDFNYNGNINATSHHYTLAGHAGDPGALFEPATYWEYTYDGLNRLTAANGQVTHYDPQQATPVVPVDGQYAYDRIGNITALSRELHSGGTQGWEYTYTAGKNRLTGVAPSGTATAAVSAPRAYGYDDAGNLKSDDHRNLDNTNYGRANLPFGLQLNVPDPATGEGSVGADTVVYLYDAADARVYKAQTRIRGKNGIPTEAAPTSHEYYLRDAAGNELGILNLNTGHWTWYAFGRERFARFRPDADQQPAFYSADLGVESLADSAGKPSDPLKNALLAAVNTTTGLLPQEVVEVHWNGADWGLLTPQQIADTLAANPEAQLTEVQRFQPLGSSYAFRLGRYVLGMDAVLATNKATRQLPNGSQPPAVWYSHNTLEVDSIIYYLYDHLGNTRVTYGATVERCGTYLDTTWATPEQLVVLSIDTVDGTQGLLAVENVVDYYPYGKVLKEYQSAAGQEKYLTTKHERDQET
ncbi:MAG: hypothetical protein AAGB22_10430, partial [Bacteroidota bacterium]